jgi:hypothetical protein
MVGGGRLLGDIKNWFPGVFALFNSTDGPYIVKMTWSCPIPKCLVHRGFYFYLVPSECGDKSSHLRHTVDEKMLYRAKTFYHDTFTKNFEHL